MQTLAPRNGRVITVLNLKGGVGKTHAVWLLASVCEELGIRILLVDTDPQGNLSNSFVKERDPARCVERLLDISDDADALSLVHRTAYAHIDIIPSSAYLSGFDESNQRNWEKTELHRSFIEPIRELRPLYDYIVFDCPPRLSLVSFAALCASDHVIVPLEPADWGAQGIMQVTAAINHVRERFNGNLQLLGYLVSRFRGRRTYHKSYLAQLRKHFGEKTFDVVIPDLAAFERAVTDAVPITKHSPLSSAAHIARRFFDEVTWRITPVGGGVSGSRKNADDERKVAV